MPIINVKLIEDVFTPDQKREIIERLTDAMVSIEGENLRPVTWVVVEEVGPLAVSTAMEEVAVAVPDAVAHVGNEVVRALLHAVEGGGGGELIGGLDDLTLPVETHALLRDHARAQRVATTDENRYRQTRDEHQFPHSTDET